MNIAVSVLLLAFAAAQDSEADRLKKEMEKLKTENSALASQLTELRDKLARSLNEKALSTAELQYARQMAERLQQDLSQLEEKQAEARRTENKKAPKSYDEGIVVPQPAPKIPEENPLENSARALLGAMERARAGQEEALKHQVLKARPLYKPAAPIEPAPVVTAPSRALEGKVTAVANEIGLVVISIGKDDGVLEGDEFTIYRRGDFVAKIAIDRADRKWAAGKVTLKKLEPRVADDVSNHIFVSGPRAAQPAPAPAAVVTVGPGTSSDELRSLRKELDDVRSQVQSLTDRILPSWKDAGVTVEEASEALCTQLQIGRGLLVRRVREGSPAARVLKVNDVIPDRTEAQLLDLLRSGGPLPLRRKGKAETYQVEPTR